ncbi:hypothetical protein OG535_23555 [Kitasatospora sp. NBC_00085]
MLGRVGQRLLDHPVRGVLGRARQTVRLTGDGQPDVQAGRGRLLDQLGDAGVGRPPGGRPVRIVPQDPDHLGQAFHGRAGARPDLPGRLPVRRGQVGCQLQGAGP